MSCIGTFPTPPNAVASTDKIDVGVSVNITCEAGYHGVGKGTSTCLADGQWSSPAYQCDGEEWPNGTYTLLQPFNGCPAQFSTGQRIWRPEKTGYSTFSTNNNLQGYANQTQIEWHFCTKTGSGDSESWPAGDYCILRKGGSCPAGFNIGLITFDEEDSAPSDRSQGTGTLPDGVYAANTDLYFCCKKDGSVAIEATFPVSTPFVLFRYTMASCQLITGMTVEPGYTFFDSEPNGNIDKSEGSVPYVDGPPTWHIYHCYYY
ncbi:uncharacterized protein LOC117340795 [Pecten maximus]|uniref:uncharacterized protein LOC117340795 n=1 Tax=Pecten maximus TaxID=6579 RepID=UPI0014587617|nr:uncharacterized protein LOC117340795 [Pecten maximus]